MKGFNQIKFFIYDLEIILYASQNFVICHISNYVCIVCFLQSTIVRLDTYTFTFWT